MSITLDPKLQLIIKNWDSIYTSYAACNPDLRKHGYISKRDLLGHFVTYGYKENRKFQYNIGVINDMQSDTAPTVDIETTINTVVNERCPEVNVTDKYDLTIDIFCDINSSTNVK